MHIENVAGITNIAQRSKALVRFIAGCVLFIVWWLLLFWFFAEFFPRMLLEWMGLKPNNWFINTERQITKLIFIVVSLTADFYACSFFVGKILAAHPGWHFAISRDYLLAGLTVYAASYLTLIAYLLSVRDRDNIFFNSILLRIINMRKNLILLFLIFLTLVSPLPSLSSKYLYFPSILMALLVVSSFYKLINVAYDSDRYFDAVRHFIVTKSHAVLANMGHEVQQCQTLLHIPKKSIPNVELFAPRCGYLSIRNTFGLHDQLIKQDPSAVFSLKHIYPFTLIQKDDLIATVYAHRHINETTISSLIVRDIPRQLAWLYDVRIMLAQQIYDAERTHNDKLATYALLLSENLLEEFKPYAMTQEPALQIWGSKLEKLRNKAAALLRT